MSLRTRQLPLKKRLLFRAIAVAASLVFITVGLELVLRVYHGTWLTFEPLIPKPWDRTRGADVHARYDLDLGWVPRASGQWANGAKFSVGADGFRSNGAHTPPGDAPILAIGDSLTFGDEVGDQETWPAHLEALIDQRVLNAGVFAARCECRERSDHSGSDGAAG